MTNDHSEPKPPAWSIMAFQVDDSSGFVVQVMHPGLTREGARTILADIVESWDRDIAGQPAEQEAGG